MKKFTEIKHKYQIMAFDYTTRKEYVYDKDFDTYEEAMEAITKIEPPSKVCGFSINEIPDITFDLNFDNPFSPIKHSSDSEE